MVLLAANGEVTIDANAVARSSAFVYLGMLDKASEASGAVTSLLRDYIGAKAYLLGDTSSKPEYERYNATIDAALAGVKTLLTNPGGALVKVYESWTAQMDQVQRALKSGDTDNALQLLGSLMAEVGTMVGGTKALGEGVYKFGDTALQKFAGGALERASFESFGKVTGNYSAVKPGPLSPYYAETFSGGRYTEVILKEDTILYRAGTVNKPVSAFFSPVEPNGIVQSRIDSAIMPKWPDGGLSPIDSVYSYKIPAGTKVYIGQTGTQGDFYVGGGQQVVIPNATTLPGLTIQTIKPLK